MSGPPGPLPTDKRVNLNVMHFYIWEEVIWNIWDRHGNMGRTVIEEWVENILIPNLLKGKKLATVTNKAMYHSTFFEKKRRRQP